MQQMRQEHKMLTIEFFNVHKKAGQMSRFFYFERFQRRTKHLVNHLF